MKKIIVPIIFISSLVNSYAQTRMAPRKVSDRIDTALAKKLGADEYGMKKYVLCLLKTGPNKSLSADSVKKCFEGHMMNIKKLSLRNKLIVAGPFTDGTELEGIFIFNVETVKEAEELTNTDPAVKAGLLSMELHPWYSSAALMQVPSVHKKIARKSH